MTVEPTTTLHGILRAFHLFDIAEEIDLARLHEILGTRPSKREPSFRHPAPQYVRFESPPVSEPIEAVHLASGEVVNGRIRYFDYGVASLELQMRFAGEWPEVLDFANRWFDSTELEEQSRTLLQNHLQRLKGALKKPYESWISENYFIVQFDQLMRDGQIVAAEELIRGYGVEIAQLVRGELVPLSTTERQEVLQASMSYSSADLLVIGWEAAFVYDTPDAGLSTIDLLEYANTQLLEFRHYDEVLTRVLADVYKRLEQKRGIWSRWRLAREAEKLNTIRLDVRELSERTDNAIKFLSDMFYARAYRLAAARVGVSDYRNLVTEKLTTAEDLYDSMVNEFHQARAFVLELMIVIILIIDLIFLFRGKS